MTIRKRPFKAVEHAVREQCKQACANPDCREWSTATHELHHIDEDRSNSVVENLLLLCGSCHNKATASVFSESDVLLWKRMAEAGYLPPPKGQSPNAPVINIQHNEGMAAHTIHVEKVQIPRDRKPKRVPTPGLIEADPDMRTYADYLVKRYIEWRKNGQKLDKRKFFPGSAHGILAEGFGSVSSVMLIPQHRFLEWVAQAQYKIDRTAFGRNNRNRNYHTWEEHLAERHGH